MSRIIENIVQKVLDDYGITSEHIEKVKSVINHIEVHEYSDKTEIEIKLKNVKIVIDK